MVVSIQTLLSETRYSSYMPKLPPALPRASAPLDASAGVDVETAEDALEDGATGVTASTETNASGVSIYAIPGAPMDRASPRMHG